MPDEFYIALQATHILVFGLLLFHREWRVTALFLLVSAAVYYFITEWTLTLREEMYLVRAFIDLSFGLLIAWLGNKGKLIQPLILAMFASYHLIAFAAFKLEFYSFLRAAYVPGTNLLNVLQILVVVGGIGEVIANVLGRIGHLFEFNRRRYVAHILHGRQLPRLEKKKR